MRINADTGSGFIAEQAATDFLNPPQTGVQTEPRLNFPLPPGFQRLSIHAGETAGRLSIIRMCRESTLLAVRCAAGTQLLADLTGSRNVALSSSGTELLVDRQNGDPELIFGSLLAPHLQPSSALVAAVRALFFVAAFGFVYPFFAILIQLTLAWWSRAASLTLAVAAVLRLLFFLPYAPGKVSDSDLFLRYLSSLIFGLPGIRGLVYPAFLSLCENSTEFAGAVQLCLGAYGAVLVFFLLRSFDVRSFWAVPCALAATCIPTLVGMEALILSESLSLFLLLAALALLRWVMLRGRGKLECAALGAAVTLLYHTKPQFGFAIIVFAASLWWCGRLGTERRKATGGPWWALYFTPVLAFWLFAAAITNSAGNFRGVSSTLGYSLFNHGQQNLRCTVTDPDPLIQIFCRAESALGPHGSPLSYTAWVIYPGMHELHKSFPEVTDSYARLSLRQIRANPQLYMKDVASSFLSFWTDRISMVDGLYAGGRRDHALLNTWAPLLRTERWARDLVVVIFLLNVILFALIFRTIPIALAKFCSICIALVMGSAVLQALVEFGPENARLETPTEPLLLLTTALILTSFRRITT